MLGIPRVIEVGLPASDARFPASGDAGLRRFTILGLSGTSS